jgi:hypothetical protein
VDEVRDAIVQGVATRTYHGRTVSSVDGETGTYTALSNGDVVQMTFAGMFEARLEEEKVAKEIGRGRDLFVLGTVPIDRPLGDPVGVETLVIEAAGEGAARLAPGPRQTVAEREDGTRVVSSGRGHGIASIATEEEIREALAATAEFPAGDARIVALAREAVGDAAGDAAKVARLVRFVSEYVEDALSAADAFNALDVLVARKGDCTEHTALFTALARAAGVPARTVSGLMYMGDGVKAFGGHAWNEVVIDGKWVPVDATWDQTEVDGTHIAIGHGDRGDMAHLWVLGRLTFRLVSVERKPAPAARLEEVVRKTLLEDFPDGLDPEATDAARGEFRTKWKCDPPPWHRQAKRIRARVKLEGETLATVEVLVEINENFDNPHDMDAAKWVPGDARLAERLKERLRAKIESAIAAR